MFHFLKFVAVELEILNRLWAHGARSFRSGNCVCRSEQVDARVGGGFVVKALAWISPDTKSKHKSVLNSDVGRSLVQERWQMLRLA